MVERFEEAVARYVGSLLGVATTSCTTALQLALELEGIGSGDEVVVPAFTFIATANAVIAVGASPVLCDIDLQGFLGLSNDVPRGFTDIRIKFKVKADVDNMERLKRLTEYSPVLNTITQGANVDIRVEAK